ncbi:glycosyltransferase family 4 protein [Saprospiraceae bacterium]|nr:glycosyltransferase family 4 protein [Saprospiraceae bacterium]
MKRKIKVLYFQHTGTYGGPCRSLGFTLPHLIENGVDPYVVCPKGKAQDYYRKFTNNVIDVNHRSVSLIQTVIGYPRTLIMVVKHYVKNILYASHIEKIILDVRPDLIHLNEFGMFRIGKIAKKYGIPTVAHARTMPNKHFPRLNRYIFREFEKYCQHLFCISGSVYDKMDVKHKSIVYNPVEKIPELKSFSDDKDVVQFLSLSAVRKSKGIIELMEAAKTLEGNASINILVAGKIDLDVPKLSGKQKIMSALGLIKIRETLAILEQIRAVQKRNKNIEFLGHVEDIDSLMRDKVDVMLAPMRLNSPPRSVFEAGVHGIPSILSMEEKIEDVIENNVNGFLIDENSSSQLVEAMLKLVNDKDLRIAMGKKARERFIKNHDAKSIATKFYTVYKTVLKINIK